MVFIKQIHKLKYIFPESCSSSCSCNVNKYMTLILDKAPKMWLVRLSIQRMGAALVKKHTKIYFNYMLIILQIHLNIHVHNNRIPCNCTFGIIKVLEQLILYFNCASKDMLKYF